MKANAPLRAVVAIGAALIAASCAAPPPPPAPAPVVSQPRAVPPPPPLPRSPADWRDAPQTPGTWNWSLVAGRSTATYGMPGRAPLASLSCHRASGEVLLGRAGTATAAVPVAVATTALRRPLLSDPERSPTGWLMVPISARDPLLDAIAFSRGRFALEAAGLETLYLPSWPEISRVIEDCR